MNEDIINKYVLYFYEEKHIDFTKEREAKFREVMSFCIDNYEPTTKGLEGLYDKCCMNKDCFVNPRLIFNILCEHNPILNKKWIQYNKTKGILK